MLDLARFPVASPFPCLLPKKVLLKSIFCRVLPRLLSLVGEKKPQVRFCSKLRTGNITVPRKRGNLESSYSWIEEIIFDGLGIQKTPKLTLMKLSAPQSPNHGPVERIGEHLCECPVLLLLWSGLDFGQQLRVVNPGSMCPVSISRVPIRY